MRRRNDLLGVIPARGGSKGIYRKNLASLRGKSLLAYSVEAASQSCLEHVVVSTEDDEIADAARSLNADVLVRPPKLAADNTQMIEVMRHVAEQADPQVIGFVLLQPTSPLRVAADIDEAIALFDESAADSVVSVVRVPHRYTPTSLMTMEDGRLEPLSLSEGPLDRHDKTELFARNGPAVVVSRRSVIESGRLYGDVNLGFEMPWDRSVDVDDPEDLVLAKLLLQSRSSGLDR